MSTPDFLPGRRYLLRRYNTTTLKYDFLAIVENKSLDQTNNYADTTAPDEAQPTNIPVRKSIKTTLQWDVTFSGMIDTSKLALLRADCASESPVNYAFEFVPTSGIGAGYYSGAIFFEKLTLAGEQKGMTSFSVSARGDDVLTWTDGAVPA